MYATVMHYLGLLANLAPAPNNVWMLPFAGIVACIMHAVITHRVGMLVAAFFMLCFYIGGLMFFPTFTTPLAHQKILIVAMHQDFTVLTAYLVLVSVMGSLGLHALRFRTREQKPKPVPQAVKDLPKKDKQKAAPKEPPQTLNQLDATRKAKKRLVHQPQ